MKLLQTVLMAVVLAGVCAAARADWPTYRGDNGRSGGTDEKIDAAKLGLAWTWQSPMLPQPAWDGPANRDAYHGKEGLTDLRGYDLAFHPIIAGDRVYFGSTADDAVHCLDAKTGKELWRFTTGGPVRIAPSFADGKLYFGSDDGYAYCIDADGKLVWKSSPTEGRQAVILNGRFISAWPVRTGVLVENSTAYFAACMLPWNEAYVCAVDAGTGQPEVNEKTGLPKGAGRYFRRTSGYTCEGAMALWNDVLLSPQGRVWAAVFDPIDGSARKDTSAFGQGSFGMISKDGLLAMGGFTRNLNVAVTDLKGQREKVIYSYSDAKMITMLGGTDFAITDDSVYAVDRATKKPTWRKPTGPAWMVIAAGDTVFVGGTDKVMAFAAKDGALLREAAVRGKVHGLAAVNGMLVASTSEGYVYGFREFPPVEPKGRGFDAVHPISFPSAELTYGPYLEFTSPTTAVVRWGTAKESPTLCYWKDKEVGDTVESLDDPDKATRQFEEKTLKRDHEARLDGLRPEKKYEYRIFTEIDGKKCETPKFICDTAYNYAVPAVPEKPDIYGAILHPGEGRGIGVETAMADLPIKVIGNSLPQEGICVVVGLAEGRTAYEIAKRTKLRVLAVDTDAKKVEAVRELWQKSGAYGMRLAAMQVGSFDNLSLPAYCANVVVSEHMSGAPPISAAELVRILRPDGGVAGFASILCDVNPFTRMEKELPKDVTFDEPQGLGLRVVRNTSLPGAGEWTHQYGGSDNATNSHDTLGGATTIGDFELSWLGKPGPRYQVDRQVRKPAPLAANGRLFTQGFERLIAMDAFNGVILWSLEVPGLVRFNMPRDASNYCIDKDSVFLAVADKCWRINATTGAVEARFNALPSPGKTWDFAWSYVGNDAGLLIGSTTKKGSSFTGWWGGGYWYDAGGGFLTAKVCSDNIFALDKKTGEKKWEYSKGVIINTTIAMGGGRLYFVESRNSKLKASDVRTVGANELWEDRFLVALDLKTGAVIYEQPITTSPGNVMYSLTYAKEKVIIAVSHGQYIVDVFDATNGKHGWMGTAPLSGGNHGAHMSRPVVMGDTLILAPTAWNIDTGEKLKDQFPTGRCGTLSASEDALFFRGSGCIAMWSRSTKQYGAWARLRPDCWLSAIPANGMVLAPEGGGGCWCGIWLETSAGFVPPPNPRPQIVKPDRAFVGSMKVELASRDPKAVIHYTLDGMEPTAASPKYAGPFEIRKSLTLKARAFTGRPDGKAGESLLLVDGFIRLRPAPQIEPPIDKFGKSRTVKLTKQDPEGEIRYTLDGSVPTRQSAKYTEPIVLTKSAVVTARVFYSDGAEGDVGRREYTKVEPTMIGGVEYVPGVTFKCYEGFWSTMPKFAELTPVRSGATAGFDYLAARSRNNGMALEFDGWIRITKEGSYKFIVTSDDGSRLLIDDEIVVNNDGMHGPVTKEASVELKEGLYQIRLEYFDLVGGNALSVQVEGPGMPRQAPDSMLFRKDIE